MIKLIKKFVAILGVSLLVIGHVDAAAQVTFYHHDALGSVIAKSDEDGSLYLNEEYQPYGEKVYGTGDTFGDSDDWYTGKNYSDELDLTYFGARWYDAKQGRFLSMDPAPVSLTNMHSFNRYHYGNNNPYKYVDPDGREAHFFGSPTFSQAETYAIKNKLAPQLKIAQGIKGFKNIRSVSGGIATGSTAVQAFSPHPLLKIPAAVVTGVATTIEIGADIALGSLESSMATSSLQTTTGKIVKNAAIDFAGKKVGLPSQFRDQIKSTTDLAVDLGKLANDLGSETDSDESQ